MTTNTEQTSAVQAFDKLLATYHTEQHRLAVEAHTEEEIDACSDRIAYVEQQMWQTAAPNLRAVLIKMEIANHDCDMPPPAATASILADLRRLSGLNSSPVFQADLWLIDWEKRGGSYLVREGEAILCGDPTNPSQRRLTRELEKANGGDAVKALIVKCCKGLEVEAAE